jgi:hypothetical protein
MALGCFTESMPRSSISFRQKHALPVPRHLHIDDLPLAAL